MMKKKPKPYIVFAAESLDVDPSARMKSTRTFLDAPALLACALIGFALGALITLALSTT